jgi:hypothetical protein
MKRLLSILCCTILLLPISIGFMKGDELGQSRESRREQRLQNYGSECAGRVESDLTTAEQVLFYSLGFVPILRTVVVCMEGGRLASKVIAENFAWRCYNIECLKYPEAIPVTDDVALLEYKANMIMLAQNKREFLEQNKGYL